MESTITRREPTEICNAKHAMELLNARGSNYYNKDTAGDFSEEYWHWSDCRRIYSEPAGGLQDSRGSVTSYGYEDAIEDDVFSDCSDEEFNGDEKGTHMYIANWTYFTLPPPLLAFYLQLST